MKNKRRTKAQWLQIFEEQRDSGLTIKAFCAHNGLLIWSRRSPNENVCRARRHLFAHRRSRLQIAADETTLKVVKEDKNKCYM